MLIMLTEDHIEEMKLLAQFSLDGTLNGLKVHANEASEATVKAAQRLFDKGLTDQIDGGYLTERGVEAAKHVDGLFSLLV